MEAETLREASCLLGAVQSPASKQLGKKESCHQHHPRWDSQELGACRALAPLPETNPCLRLKTQRSGGRRWEQEYEVKGCLLSDVYICIFNRIKRRLLETTDCSDCQRDESVRSKQMPVTIQRSLRQEKDAFHMHD